MIGIDLAADGMGAREEHVTGSGGRGGAVTWRSAGRQLAWRRQGPGFKNGAAIPLGSFACNLRTLRTTVAAMTAAEAPEPHPDAALLRAAERKLNWRILPALSLLSISRWQRPQQSACRRAAAVAPASRRRPPPAPTALPPNPPPLQSAT